MYLGSEDYDRWVLQDVEKYKGVRKPAKAGLLERTFTKKLDPALLHPNPEDEFTWPSVGPKESIIEEYAGQIRKDLKARVQSFEEPVLVEKMLPDGYQLINGHHRWMAAMKMHLPAIHVQIVNYVHPEDVDRALDRSVHDRRASFDLDEVLFAPPGSSLVEEAPKAPLDGVFTGRLRKGVPALLRQLQDLGIDVWVYTSGSWSADDIEALMAQYGVSLDGIVNGMNAKRKKDTGRIRASLAGKYRVSFHIDDGHILYVDRDSGKYEFITLGADEAAWAGAVTERVRSLL